MCGDYIVTAAGGFYGGRGGTREGGAFVDTAVRIRLSENTCAAFLATPFWRTFV